MWVVLPTTRFSVWIVYIWYARRNNSFLDRGFSSRVPYVVKLLFSLNETDLDRRRYWRLYIGTCEWPLLILIRLLSDLQWYLYAKLAEFLRRTRSVIVPSDKVVPTLLWTMFRQRADHAKNQPIVRAEGSGVNLAIMQYNTWCASDYPSKCQEFIISEEWVPSGRVSGIL
jgi:hypothetical protein